MNEMEKPFTVADLRLALDGVPGHFRVLHREESFLTEAQEAGVVRITPDEDFLGEGVVTKDGEEVFLIGAPNNIYPL